MEISICDAIRESLLTWFSVDVDELKDLPKPKMLIQFRSKVKLEWITIQGHTFLAIHLLDKSFLSKRKRAAFNYLVAKVSTGASILIFLDSITSDQARFLSDLNFAYVTSSKSAYIPQLFFVCSDPIKVSEPVEKPPTTQVRLLEAHILLGYMEGKIPKETLASKIPIACSRSARSRALKALEALNYVRLGKVGINSSVEFISSRIDLWNARKNVFPKLSSGLRLMDRAVLDALDLDYEELILSGESALSAKTLWSQPPEPSYAITVKNKGNLPLSSMALHGLLKSSVLSAMKSKTVAASSSEPLRLEIFGYEPSTSDGCRKVKVLSPLFIALYSADNQYGDTRGCFEKLQAKVQSELALLDQIDG